MVLKNTSITDYRQKKTIVINVMLYMYEKCVVFEVCWQMKCTVFALFLAKSCSAATLWVQTSKFEDH